MQINLKFSISGEIIGDFDSKIKLFIQIGSDLYIFFRDPAKIISFEDKDESGRSEFVVGFAGEGESGITVIHVDI